MPAMAAGKDPQGAMHYAAFDRTPNAGNIGKKASTVKQARFLADGYQVRALSVPGGRTILSSAPG